MAGTHIRNYHNQEWCARGSQGEAVVLAQGGDVEYKTPGERTGERSFWIPLTNIWLGGWTCNVCGWQRATTLDLEHGSLTGHLSIEGQDHQDACEHCHEWQRLVCRSVEKRDDDPVAHPE